jgi:hypothetical protein
MKLSNQAMGALMMALQKSLMEQCDIVPLLQEMNFELDHEEYSGDAPALMISNPPVISLDGLTLPFTIEETDTEEGE